MLVNKYDDNEQNGLWSLITIANSFFLSFYPLYSYFYMFFYRSRRNYLVLYEPQVYTDRRNLKFIVGFE